MPTDSTDKPERERLLEPIDRISEILFGLIMAVTIVGSLSIATAGREDIRTVMFGALGCNIAWGLVDAVMFLIRVATERNHNLMLCRKIVRADPQTARSLIAQALPAQVTAIIGPDELESMRQRLLELRLAPRASLRGRDYAAATGIFVLVVLATFPVVAPFALTADAALAMRLSRSITIVMLCVAGFALGRHAGHDRPWLTGASMAVLGVALILAVMALGG